MNIDPLEVQKFSDVAHSWWDVNSEFRLLHEINPLRLSWITARAPLFGKSVLDVGCGGGILSESMARLGANVTGIDLAEKVLKVARLHSYDSELTINYECVAVEDMAARVPASFDVVTCMEMLEHVPDPFSVVRACATLVKPGGQVFFSTLNRNLKSYLLAIVGAEYILRLLPKGTHDYAKFITPADLSKYVRSSGMTVNAMKGLSYNPISKLHSLDDDVSVNYMLSCTRDI